MTTTILVTGSTGTIGRQVMKSLAGASGVQVLAASRPGEGRPVEAGSNVTRVDFDFRDAALAKAALAGVDKVFLLPPMLDDQVELMSRFIELARSAGVKHVVKLSAFGCEHEPGIAFGRAHRAVEKRLEASGMAWTFLRPNNFMENFLTFYPPDAEGTIYLPWGEGACSFVASEDVGAVAAVALSREGHAGKAYTLTGPEALTVGEAARTIAAATGLPIRYVDVPEEAARKGMLSAGMPAGAVDALMELHAIDKAGYAALVTGTVAELLGRPAKTFEAFAREGAARWKADKTARRGASA
jgi:uncharacterized protein YbjT (DUF2867 family)